MRLNALCSVFLFFFSANLFSQDLKNPLTLDNEWPGYSIGDPYILKFNGYFYLYCSTKDSETGVKTWSSKDLMNWHYEGLCTTEPITKGAYAPEVTYWDGKFYMYTSPAGHGHYVLSGDSPTGPFEVISSNLGKSIDGSVFIDDDAEWYFYHASGQGIMGCSMSDPITIGTDRNLNAWMNNGWTEGPCVFKRNGKYYMIYTGNHVISKGYRIDYASGTTGPIDAYTPAENQNPILLDALGYHVGLGHGSIFIGPDLDSYYLTYHNLVSGNGPFRRLNFDRIAWNVDKMYLLGPTEYAQQNPEYPDAYDFFERDTIGPGWHFPAGGRWTISQFGSLTQDTTIKGDSNLYPAILDSVSSSDFTAEFNLKELAPDDVNATYGAIFNYSDEQNYGVALLNSNTGSLEINFLNNNIWGSPVSASIPFQMDFTRWHTIRIESFNGELKFFVDKMMIASLSDASGQGKIGYITDRCHAEFGFIAFSNEVQGSGTFNIYKPVPGIIPAVQYISGGEGIGFHEEDPSELSGIRIRNDEVELVESPLGGYAVASLEANEWFDYHINVYLDGLYNINLIYATEVEDCKLRFLSDGEDISGLIELPQSDGGSYLIKDISLNSGYHTLRVEINTGPLHLYSMEFVKADNGAFDRLLTFDSSFETGWKYYDGSWTIDNQNAFIDGHGKRTYGSDAWRDYTVETDILFERSMNAGLIFRVNNPALGGAGDSPSLGTDFLQGYFVGFNYSTVVLGKHNYNWKSLTTASGTFTLNTWYHLRVVVNENRIRVYVDDMVNPMIDYEDPIPFINGMAGLRSYNTAVRYNNFRITSKLLTTSSEDDKIPDEKGQLLLYPNPSIGEAFLSFENEEERLIYVQDLNGRILCSFHSNDKKIRVPDFDGKNGLYIIRVEDSSGTHAEKMIIRNTQ